MVQNKSKEKENKLILIPKTEKYVEYMLQVIFKIPLIGYLQTFLATKGGWIIVVLIPCLSIISYDILKILKLLNRKTKLIRK